MVIKEGGKAEKYRRITKRSARKLCETEEILLTPCKAPSMYFAARLDIDYGFDEFVNAFTYYNCNKETGDYPSFFVRIH